MLSVNHAEFASKVKALGKQALENTGMTDYYHMRAIETFGYVLFIISLGLCYNQLMWIAALCMTFSLMIKWLLMHHIGHGGYNKIANIPARYHSKKYAIGWRRYWDWFDWIKPEAWNYEHNYLHHYFTGEEKDPDLVERNLDWLAQAKIPYVLKFLIVLFFASTWKFTYYSARTLSYLKGYNEVNFGNFFDLRKKSQQVMWFELFLPYVLFHFVFPTGLLNYFFPGVGDTYLQARLLAEALHNMHTFLVIIPNHSGPDIYRFDKVDASQRTEAHFYLRQILGSANFNTGSEWLDLSQMYLNYQIEHHLFPNLSMLQYRKIQPQIKALCLQYNIPYVQESVWLRFYKMVQIATGQNKMLVDKK